MNITIAGPRQDIPFDVDCKTGEMYVTGELDYDDPVNRSFSLTVRATDGGGLSVSEVVTVNIQDVNDNPPIFYETSDFTSGTEKDIFVIDTVTEDSPAGQEVITLYVDDADDEPSLEYNMTGNTTGFELIGEKIVLTSTIDAEEHQNDVYQLIVTASDTEKTATATVLIYLGLVNDFDPVHPNMDVVVYLSFYGFD